MPGADALEDFGPRHRHDPGGFPDGKESYRYGKERRADSQAKTLGKNIVARSRGGRWPVLHAERVSGT